MRKRRHGKSRTALKASYFSWKVQHSVPDLLVTSELQQPTHTHWASHLQLSLYTQLWALQSIEVSGLREFEKDPLIELEAPIPRSS